MDFQERNVPCGIDAMALHADVSKEADVEAMFATMLSAWGGIDILVNNAGLHLTKYNQPFSVLPRADLEALWDVNVMGVVACSLACFDTMQARGGGSIVSLSSISGCVLGRRAAGTRSGCRSVDGAALGRGWGMRSRRSRHVALNSAALIVLVMTR